MAEEDRQADQDGECQSQFSFHGSSLFNQMALSKHLPRAMSQVVRARVVLIVPRSDSRARARHLSQLSQQESAGFTVRLARGISESVEKRIIVVMVTANAFFILTSFRQLKEQVTCQPF